eukprot:TRINITY_DN7799_c0_g6_i1.p1 TRINITY_DN7799_c0_g6~~TRINITY_DN7799_c0_g6_i1.p1  ORF type:complete len:525 (-),score=114.43 TRINITY_DN7799_c0_g6_i1:209-1783(-)
MAPAPSAEADISAGLGVVPTEAHADDARMHVEPRPFLGPDLAQGVASPAPDSPRQVVQSSVFQFSDAEEIKSKVRQCILKPRPYSVFDFYHTTGIFQYIGRHPVFENVTLGVIALNAVYIAVDTDYNKSSGSLLDAAAGFQIMEHLFCIYFSFEWYVRFMAFKRKLDCVKDAWFVFDSTLVLMMVAETWVLTLVEVAAGKAMGGGGNTAILRLFRLLRLSRLLRMLRSLPELMILVKGMVTAMKSVCYVMFLLVMITYVFAIAFTQLADGNDFGATYFPNVAFSMYSLMVYGTFLDNLADWGNDILAESLTCLFLAGIFVCLSALTVMNMLIGVLCEVISSVASTEKEEMLTSMVSDKFGNILEQIDSNHDGLISQEEFSKVLQCPEAVKALQEVGVEPVGVVDFAEVLFTDNGKPIRIPFPKFMEGLLDLRGANTATLKDIMQLSMHMKARAAEMKHESTEKCAKCSRDMQKDVKALEAAVVRRLNSLESKTAEQIDELKSSSRRVEAQLDSMLSFIESMSAM